jgi:hydrogenase nickel incorporation protein HypA/HybF
MHELSITQSIVSICEENAGGAAVKRVTVEIGKLSAIMPDSVRFCFEVCAAGTVVEGAELVIVETPGRAACRTCGAEVAITALFGKCVCGSSDLTVVAGDEMKVRELEV